MFSLTSALYIPIGIVVGHKDTSFTRMTPESEISTGTQRASLEVICSSVMAQSELREEYMYTKRTTGSRSQQQFWTTFSKYLYNIYSDPSFSLSSTQYLWKTVAKMHVGDLYHPPRRFPIPHTLPATTPPLTA